MFDIVTLIVIAGAAALIAAFLVVFIMRGRTVALVSQVDALRRQLDERTHERDQERERAEKTALQLAAAQAERRGDQERLAWLERAEHTLREAFDALAAKQMQSSRRELIEQSKRQLDQFNALMKSDWAAQQHQFKGVVEPINVELKKLDSQVRSMEQRREGAYQGLTEQVRGIAEQYRALQTATTSLDKALRSSTVRGKWGEVQLRRLVELAGMTEHVDFDEQVSGAGSAARPDMIVHLPSGAIVPVDAKAPMDAYLDAQAADSPELAGAALKRHARALRDHVKNLAQKAYWNQFARSPEFVVLVVPYESGLSAAFSADPELLEYALANKVVVSAPTSFLALLRVVGYGWMQLELSQNAERIAATGRELLDRLGPFVDHFNKLGIALNSASDRFNDAAGSFERRILPTARRLQSLGAGSQEPVQPELIDVRTRSVQTPD